MVSDYNYIVLYKWIIAFIENIFIDNNGS